MRFDKVARFVATSFGSSLDEKSIRSSIWEPQSKVSAAARVPVPSRDSISSLFLSSFSDALISEEGLDLTGVDTFTALKELGEGLVVVSDTDSAVLAPSNFRFSGGGIIQSTKQVYKSGPRNQKYKNLGNRFEPGTSNLKSKTSKQRGRV